MTDSPWIEAELRSDLSQGDVLAGIPFCVPALPVVHLSKGQAKGNPIVWIPSKMPESPSQDRPNHALVAYRVAHGIVVSHDCAIDKKDGRGARILLAPVLLVDTLNEATQEAVRNQAHFAAMLLPGVPDIEESYADLRLITPFPKDLVSSLKRVASLSDAARLRLQQALVAFFALRELPPKN